MKSMQKVYTILLAGGSGSRMNLGQNKVLLSIGGRSCISRSAEAFRTFTNLMVLVCRREDMEALTEEISGLHLPFPVIPVEGGSSRQESVFNGLMAVPDDPEAVVMVHDGARCFVSSDVIRSALTSAQEFGSGVAAIPVSDTIKEADQNHLVQRTLPREQLNAIQTPQAFMLEALRAAHMLARRSGFQGTDDAALMEQAGFSVRLSAGSKVNIKLTTQEDLRMAEALIRKVPDIRVGHGYDVHQLAEDRKLILCGVEIPYEKGLLGHSDADVALHALMDALLGAAGLGDIGQHFPDHDDRYKGISSLLLLQEVMNLLKNNGMEPENADLTIIAQKPKLAPYIPQMKENLASALNLPLSRINVKATTTEKLGFEGRMEGISAHAVCLIVHG